MDLKETLEKILEENKKYHMFSRNVDISLRTLPNESNIFNKKNILEKLKDFKIDDIAMYLNEIHLNNYICIRELEE